MKKKVFLVALVLTAPAWAITCPTGSTPITISSGNFSSQFASAAAADGACITITGAVTDDMVQVGTTGSAGHGVAEIILTASGGLIVSAGSQHTIYIGSTGADPCGSGTYTNPAAGATMHGFYNQAGSLNLAGSSLVNYTTITSANGASPWYAIIPDASAASGSITIKNASLSNLGAAPSTYCGGGGIAYFAGITAWNGSGNTTTIIDVENTKVAGFYSFIYGANSDNPSETFNWTAKRNLLTGRTGPVSIGTYIYSIQNADFEYNTEYSPAANGSFVNIGNITVSLTDHDNAVYCGATYWCGGQLLTQTFSSAVEQNNFYYGDPSLASNVNELGFQEPNSVTSTADYGEMCQQCFYGQSWSGSVGISNYNTNQGIFYGPGGSGSQTGTGNVALMVGAVLQNVPGFFGYGPGSTLILTNNTVWQLLPDLANIGSTGIQIGDNGTSIAVLNQINENIVGGYDTCIADTGTANPGNQYVTSGTGGVGVWQNATDNCPTASYQRAHPVHFDNGSTAHPSAGTYGDVDGVNPSFLDMTRTSVTVFDSRVLGGPGTVLDYITNRGAYYSGWGSTSYNTANLSVAALVAWVKAGWTPGNAAMCPSGVTLGAVACSTAKTAILNAR